MFTMKQTLVTCMVLMGMMVISEGCVCMQRHPQTSYCSAGFALKGIVISERRTKKAENSKIFEQLGLPAPVYAYYEILVTRVYKGNVKSKEDTFARFFKVTVQTNHGSSLCGISELTKGKTYLITGRIYNNELQVNQCDWIEEYKLLSKNMKRGLRGEYQCDCKVSTCFDGYCDNDSPCKWNISYDEPIDECTQKHRMCRSDKKGQCAWMNSMFYDACTNKILLDVFKLPKQAIN